MEKFDNVRCIDLIRELADIKGMRLGDLERTAGVAPGYLSKAKKGGYLPPVEVFASMAEQLGVTVDFLIFHSSKVLTDRACDIAFLAEKLVADTYQSQLVWARYPAELLTGRSDAEFKELPVQLFNTAVDDDSGLILWDRDFHSHFDVSATIAGDAFSAKLGGQDATIFLLSVKGVDGESQFELYLESYNELEPICTTSALSTDVAASVRKLYEAVNTEAKIAGLGMGMNRVLRQYLYGQRGE